MTTLLGSRMETVRVVAAGLSEDGTALRVALADPGSTVEVVAWTDSVSDALPYVASGGAQAVLVGAPRGHIGWTAATLARDVAAVRRSARVPVILLVPEADPDAVEAALEAGVDDVLVLPQVPATIAFAIRKAQHTGSRPPGAEADDEPRGKVVTIFSPKGGTGKTVLATNLATMMASRSDQRVLLVDLDLQFGDAAIMLGLDPERTLHDLVESPGELDPTKLSGFVLHHKSGLDVLAGPMRPEQAELVTEAKVLRVLEVAAEAYDLIVVDTSPFFYGPMLALLQPTDRLLMLCGLDVPTLKNVSLSLRTLELLGFPASRTQLVLNRITPKVGLEPSDVEGALGMPVSFEIPNDPAVAPAVNRGVAVVLLEGDSEFARAVAVIADSIDSEGVPAVGVPERERSRRRWFGRLAEGRAS